MGSYEGNMDCPKCGYEYATECTFSSPYEKYEHCQRCGHSLAIEADPQDLRYSLEKRESGGIGVFYWRMKPGEEEHDPAEDTYDNDNPRPSDRPWRAPIDKCGSKPRQQVRLDKMKSLDKYKYFEVSFEENGKWFLKDFVTGQTRPYDKPVDY